MIIQFSNDERVCAKAQSEIVELSGHVHSVEDMIAIDELVQEILDNQKNF
jgi:hypothetical protein